MNSMLFYRLTQIAEHGVSAVEQGAAILRRFDAMTAAIDQHSSSKLGGGDRPLLDNYDVRPGKENIVTVQLRRRSFSDKKAMGVIIFLVCRVPISSTFIAARKY